VVRRLTPMDDRICSKVGCTREAVSTLSYDYGDQMAVLGPLGLTRDPHTYDLCSIHSERLSVPKGWQVIRHAVLGEVG
jgi:hypothetical protein